MAIGLNVEVFDWNNQENVLIQMDKTYEALHLHLFFDGNYRK
jgi:hypothetical protein